MNQGRLILQVKLKSMLGKGSCTNDLGCGFGHLLRRLTGRFEQCIGLDASRTRLEGVGCGDTEGWEFREAGLNGLFPVADASADAVIANQVVEHVLEPLKFTREIHRSLRPGRRCVVAMPNIRYPKNIAHLVFSGYGLRTAGGNTLDGAWDDGHIHYFTQRDLREIFNQSGFAHVASEVLIDLPRGGVLRPLLNRRAGSRFVREFFGATFCFGRRSNACDRS